jgi:hypothetical protein
MPRARVIAAIDADISFNAANDSDDPSAWFLDDYSLESLHMFGRTWSEKELRVTFGDLGADALIGLICDKIEEWDE